MIRRRTSIAAFGALTVSALARPAIAQTRELLLFNWTNYTSPMSASTAMRPATSARGSNSSFHVSVSVTPGSSAWS